MVIDYAHLASVRFEHSVCRESLMTTYVCMYVCMYACMYVCMYVVCMHVCTYVCIMVLAREKKNYYFFYIWEISHLVVFYCEADNNVPLFWAYTNVIDG